MSRRSARDPRADDVIRRRLAALADELAAGREQPGAAGGLRRDVPEGAEGEALRADGEPSRAGGESAGLVREPTEPAHGAGRHAARRVPLGRRARGWLADRVPDRLRGQVRLGAAQVGLVAVVLSVGLLAGAWWLVRSGPSQAGEVVPPRVSAPGAAGEGLTTAAPATAGQTPVLQPAEGAAQPSRIVVDVIGRVHRPGIVVLPAGSRVADAVRAAGGMRGRVDRTTVNLARPLADGEQVVIGLGAGTVPGGSPPEGSATPGAGPSPAGSAGSPASGLVNINTADQAELETLPGVGPVTAGAILEWREAHGAFTSVEELLEVSGIGDATLAEIAPHVTL